MSRTSLLPVGSDADVQVDGLADDNGNYQNDAVVEVESVESSDGEEVSGLTLPIAMPFVADSDGCYEGRLSHQAAFVEGKRYDVIIKATSSSGIVRRWKEYGIAEYPSA